MTAERRIDTAGLEFRLLESPRPAGSAAPTIVLVHGIGMSHRYLSRLHDELARSTRVVSVDLPGFAGLPKSQRDVDIVAMGEALGAVVAGLGEERVVLVGHSMGAQWVIEAALQRPESVSAVVAIGPVADERQRTLTAQARGLAVDTFGETPLINTIVFTDYLRCGIPWYLRQVRHMLAYPTEKRIHGLTVPVLVIRGGERPDRGAGMVPPPARFRPCLATGGDPGTPSRHPAFGAEIRGGRDPVPHLGAVAGCRTDARPRRDEEQIINPLKAAGWWLADYAYAGYWQIRATFDRSEAKTFATGDRAHIVVLPGVYESWRFMQPLIVALHGRGHPVHVVETLQRNQRPVVEMAESVAEFLEARELTDVILVAHSKGGLAGKLAMTGRAGGRVRSMLAVATPFGGSRYARMIPVRTLRAFSPEDPSILSLAQQLTVNARIVSVYADFDPHIPEGSELAGAKNVRLETGGHFRILAHPRVLAELAVLAE